MRATVRKVGFCAALLVAMAALPASADKPFAQASGGGWVLLPDGKATFGFSVQDTPDGPRGELQIIAPNKVAHHMFEVLAFEVGGNTASIEGLCRDNHDGGEVHTCQAEVQDNGNGQGPLTKGDYISIQCNGTPVAAGTLGGGNISIIAPE